MRLFIVGVLFAAMPLSASAGGAATLRLASGHVKYEVHLKTFGIGGDDVSAVNRKVIGNIAVPEGGRIEGGLIVPVVGFDSNNTKRDKDVANILKYKDYPAITFEVVEMAPRDVARVLGEDSGRVSLKARISAAGGSKIYDAVFTFRSAGTNKIRFTTSIAAKFTDFGIRPPRLGLILKTAPDEIELSGDLVFDVEMESDTPP